MNLNSGRPHAPSLTHKLYFGCRRLGRDWEPPEHLHAAMLRLFKWLDGRHLSVDEFLAGADLVVELRAPVDLTALSPPVAACDTPRSERRRRHIPLRVAAAVLYRAFIDEKERRAHMEKELDRRLDAAAHVLSIAIPICRMDRKPPAAIDSQALAKGIFVGGAQRLRFPDGQEPITALGIRTADLELIDQLAFVITALRQSDLWRTRFVLSGHEARHGGQDIAYARGARPEISTELPSSA
ncbi:MAG: hypothetical protein ACT4P3_14500 [Betaproteobacteria bacterium]